MFRSYVLALAAAVLASTLTAFDAPAGPPPLIEVTACGQAIPNGAIGYLTADLTCPANSLVGVRLGRRAKLDLRGFTLTGGGAGVACEPMTCDEEQCWTSKAGSIEVFGGTLTGTKYYAVTCSKVTLHDVTIVDNQGEAVIAYQGIDIRDSHIENAAGGLKGKRLRLVNVTIDNAVVVAQKAELTSSSITNARDFGIEARHLRMTASSVTGSGTDPRCNVDFPCADLSTEKRPRLDTTSTCGTSLVADFKPPYDIGGTWGVCAND